MMNTQIIFDCIFMVGFSFLGFSACDRKRIRADWAKKAFIFTAIIGVLKGAIALVWDAGWIRFGSGAGLVIDAYLYHFANGLLLGLILCLIFSGQLAGTKKALNPQGEAAEG